MLQKTHMHIICVTRDFLSIFDRKTHDFLYLWMLSPLLTYLFLARCHCSLDTGLAEQFYSLCWEDLVFYLHTGFFYFGMSLFTSKHFNLLLAEMPPEAS